MNDLILYTTEDSRSQIQLRSDRQTVWLTQRENEMSEFREDIVKSVPDEIEIWAPVMDKEATT